jgi:hypothetical protein
MAESPACPTAAPAAGVGGRSGGNTGQGLPTAQQDRDFVPCGIHRRHVRAARHQPTMTTLAESRLEPYPITQTICHLRRAEPGIDLTVHRGIDSPRDVHSCQDDTD